MLKAALVLLVSTNILVSCGKSDHHGDGGDVYSGPMKITSSKRALTLAIPNEDEADTSNFKSCINGGYPANSLDCNYPYIDLGKTDPIANILKKTLISDSWQKDRLETYLKSAHPQIIEMFSCVKAVEIAGDIRPAHYSSSTAAIYLDADFFAVTKEERASVDSAPDYRKRNADALKYRLTRFFTQNGKMQLSSNLDEAFRAEMSLAYLLTHELAHACDFKARELKTSQPSEFLPSSPLDAASDFAYWLYAGNPAAKLKIDALTPELIGQAFDTNKFVDFYSYVNKYEHFAELVQKRMFFELYGVVDTDLIIDDNQPELPTSKLSDAKVLWAKSGKICDPGVFELSSAAIKSILPNFPLSADASKCLKAKVTIGTPLKDSINTTDSAE